ncbi:HupE/UreJ family protein [Agromyces intestinalis]|uniref:HupE/UreJ family protein n=1 Tax=Agromyces intestinalis TaxID=2592652 RepID=A0A5C1YJB4_9MICO|nr:HupE/UreJ family protein [Agromyces intestinalis]QEO14892.1 HupE/UreJ family protein [Agromyces intestinalis]
MSPAPARSSRHPRRPRHPFALGRIASAAAGLAAAGLALVGALLPTAAATAHGFTSTVYVEVTAPAPDRVRAALELEYDLLVVSAAEYEHDPALFDEGMALFETGDEARALDAHADTVLAYVSQRFTVTADGVACESEQTGGFGSRIRDDVPYAQLVLDFTCPAADGEHAAHAAHEVRSSLFPDEEGYVRDTKTIVTYELDGANGSAALDASHPSFSTGQSLGERFGEFFLLGAEHLLSGIDHILFLLALIIGSRRLRDVVLAATTFTVAHSVTFLLAALGVVDAPPAVVEPVIAGSIAVVAIWYLRGLWRRRDRLYLPEPPHRGPLGLNRADWSRLGVVFAFGLVHGLGFAGALGIDEPWSWTLLWSLLVFNIGIEAVQLGIIALVFPALTLLRRRMPRTALWASVALATGITGTALVWFTQRVLGLE